MSMMNCSAAIQAVLDEAAARMDNLILIHVDAHEDTPPAALSRRLTLPLSSDAQLAFALGCAQAGLRPVLDLTAVRDAGERLEAAFAALPRAARRPLAIRISARRCPALPGVRVIAPANARECAGAMRFALQAGLICLIVENPLGAYDACEVPDDPNELFSGAPLPIEEAPAPEETEEEAMSAETAVAAAVETHPTPVLPPTPVTTPVPRGELAFRTRAYDPAELERTARLLGIARAELAALCCAGAGQSAEVILETDGEPGETACIPPEKGDACLWVGRDHLTLCWNARALSAQAARALMKDTAALLELPARLILARKA